MKIQLISDLHIDINEKYPLDLHKNGSNDIFTLIAGDVSGFPKMTIDWLKKNIHQGAFICGNHDAYDSTIPIEDIKNLYHKKFPLNSNITFFDEEVDVLSKEIADGILLVADVLYTDYRLPIPYRNVNGNETQNMFLADPRMNRHGGMNDFNYGRCKTKIIGVNDNKKMDEGTYRLVPQYYLEHHKRAFKKITDIVEQNKDKKIILMAHHGLSPQCLDENYHEDNVVDASYVSDKEDWIKAHPNIKCIFSGHIHCRKSFKVGETLYVMNALGYCERHLKQFNSALNEIAMWTPDCFLDTDTWTVEWKKNENDEWNKQAEEDYNRFMKLAPFFF